VRGRANKFGLLAFLAPFKGDVAKNNNDTFTRLADR